MIQKMKKSKGFTLIEMLVVIAIIAVLVSIVVPVVGNSTTKARAAADAANLRTVAASASIALLDGKTDITSSTKVNANNLPNNGAISPKSTFAKDSKLTIYVVNNEVVATFGAYTIDDFTKFADGTTTSTTDLEGSYKTVPSEAIEVFKAS